jgi:hypothetical protein
VGGQAGVGAQASARETAELTMKAKAEDKITIYGPKSDDGEYGVPDVALPNVALPSAGRGDHRQTFSSPPTMPHQRPFQ